MLVDLRSEPPNEEPANWVLLHAYGIDEVIDEVVYTLLRQLAIAGDEPLGYRFAVVTDRPGAFDRFRESGLPLEIIEYPLEKFQAWRGAIDFVHRVKIEMIKDFCSSHRGKVLYLDSDAYPRHDLTPVFDRIGERSFVMDTFDGLLDKSTNPEHFRWEKFVTEHQVRLRGHSIHIPTSTQMWIAGVIGFPISEAALLDDVLSLTDQIYPLCPQWNAEQLAFSFVLGDLGTITSTEEHIFHYWDLRGFRQLIKKLLDRYRDRPLDELVAASGNILPEVLHPEKKAFDDARSFHWLWVRYPYRMSRVAEVLGRTWDISRFDFLLNLPVAVRREQPNERPRIEQPTSPRAGA